MEVIHHLEKYVMSDYVMGYYVIFSGVLRHTLQYEMKMVMQRG